jgi:hypothetical protein|tara:strand:+ start:61 stop:423 length:363 start_codon:yes stop_codon:yes gene_type:complete
MATLFTKIKLYLDARDIDAVDEMNKHNLRVLNSGQVALGNFTSVIAKWDIGGVPQPSQAELDVLESEADAAEALDKVHQNRKTEYPTIEELVVALYDTDDKAAIDSKRAEIKLKYPKPGA